LRRDESNLVDAVAHQVRNDAGDCLAENALGHSSVELVVIWEAEYELHKSMREKWQSNLPAKRHGVSIRITQQSTQAEVERKEPESRIESGEGPERRRLPPVIANEVWSHPIEGLWTKELPSDSAQIPRQAGRECLRQETPAHRERGGMRLLECADFFLETGAISEEKATKVGLEEMEVPGERLIGALPIEQNLDPMLLGQAHDRPLCINVRAGEWLLLMGEKLVEVFGEAGGTGPDYV
jgi:hypothetical protein